MNHYFKNLFNKTPGIKEINPELLKKKPLPRHIAVIMDGNGRWAQKRALPRAAGHRAGMEALKRTVDAFLKLEIPYLTVYAFSTENWKRPQEEIDALMGLLVEYVERELKKLNNNGVRVRAIGKIERMPQEAQLQIARAIEKTAQNKKLNLQIALNYGGRMELVEAVRQISKDVKHDVITLEEIDENSISRYLYTCGIPDPDLIVRPSGEQRISNFLLWQSAYSEFWATSILWPDFTAQDLYRAIYDYQQRNRRYGGI